MLISAADGRFGIGMTEGVFPCDVIVEPTASDGVRNMQVDAELLQQACCDGQSAVVRIYRWNQPTLSLGYFQRDVDDSLPLPLQQCPRVQRLTGGGAILHDREITYSCAVPAAHPIRSEPLRLYEIVHAAIIDCLAQVGVTATLRRDAVRAAAVGAAAAEPVLCFFRGDERDIVLKGRKIVGSAQRRRRGAILQHGSILVSASPLAPEIPGIADLQPGFDESRFAALLPDAIASAVGTFGEL